jgi:hypothetical protein
MPCPSPDETLTQRPDGSYVCMVAIPPDPGTGPVLASPALMFDLAAAFALSSRTSGDLPVSGAESRLRLSGLQA